jgi:hypothetical protein
MRLEPRGEACPEECSASDGTPVPRGQVREVASEGPASGGDPRFEPAELAESGPFIIDKLFRRDHRSGFEQHNFRSCAREIKREGRAAGAGTDDDNDISVVQIVAAHARLSVSTLSLEGTTSTISSPNSSICGSGSQERSLNPRCMYPPSAKDGPGYPMSTHTSRSAYR